MNYGPDRSFTQFEMVHGAEKIVVGSWHTVETRSPKIFASHSGLTSLNGRTKAEALAAEPVAYQRFRASFDEILKDVSEYKKR